VCRRMMCTDIVGLLNVVAHALQELQSVRQRLMRLWETYQLLAVIIQRLRATQKLSKRTERLLTSVERSTDGRGVYDILCRLHTMILSLNSHEPRPSCKKPVKAVDRVMSRLKVGARASRVQAAYSAAVLSVTARQLLRRSAFDAASVWRTSTTLSRSR